MPPGITPHSLRRTYISLMLEASEDPRVVMQQVGHTDAGLTLRIHAQVMKRRDGESTRRVDAFLRSIDWVDVGRNLGPDPIATNDEDAKATKNRLIPGGPQKPSGGLEPPTPSLPCRPKDASSALQSHSRGHQLRSDCVRFAQLGTHFGTRFGRQTRAISRSRYRGAPIRHPSIASGSCITTSRSTAAFRRACRNSRMQRAALDMGGP